jgi:uncharacterized protein (TIGR02145 family)
MVEGTLEITISNQIVLVTSISITGGDGGNVIDVPAGKLQLSETVDPADASNKVVTWSIVSGGTYASVSVSGLVTALKDGVVIVRATATDGSGVFGSFTIIITNQTIYVDEIIVLGQDGATVIPETETTLQMEATVLPVNADNTDVAWSVINDTGSATIDSNGLLTKVSKGLVKARATAVDGTGNYGEQVITLYEVDEPSVKKNIAPVGWHIPSRANGEWDDMVYDLFGGSYATAGAHFKEAGLVNWDTPNTDADNSTGFTALPGGNRLSDGTFQLKNKDAFFWSDDDFNDGTAQHVTFLYNSAIFGLGSSPYNSGLSIRCVKNSTILSEGATSTVTDIDGNVYQTKCINGKEYMLSNLRVTRFNDGTPIPEVTDPTEWEALTSPARCWYNNTPSV